MRSPEDYQRLANQVLNDPHLVQEIKRQERERQQVNALR